MATLTKNKSNQANVLVVLRDNDYNEEEAKLLKKIINATGTDFEKEIILLKLKDEESIYLFDVLTSLKVNQVIVFGLNSNALGLNLIPKKYEIFSVSGQNVLLSDSLNVLLKDEQSKKSLWQSLKIFFHIDGNK